MNDTEAEISEMIKETLIEARDEISYGDGSTFDPEHKDMISSIAETSSFQEEGILTQDEGFVLFTANGQRYQIIIKEW